MSEDYLKRGIFFSIASAVCFGCVTTFARITYEQGSNSLTVGIFRSVFGITLCLLLILLQSKKPMLSSDKLKGVFFVSLFTSGIALGYLGAVQFIPVGLAAIIFFTWPILLLIYLSVRQPGTIPKQLLFSFSVAFAGLFLVIGPVFSNLNLLGISLALIAACSAAGVFVTSQRFFQSLDLIVAGFWVNFFTLMIICLITFSSGQFKLPATELGHWTMLFASGGYACGLLTMFMAIQYIGAARSALYFNLEPVIATIAAMLLLGELLSRIQLAGFILIMSILFYTSVRRQHQDE